MFDNVFKMWILFFIMCMLLISSTNSREYTDIQICFPTKGFYKNYYPPSLSNKNNDDEIYSVSNNQRISRPILAYLCTEDQIPIDANYIRKNLRSFTITSEPVETSSTDYNLSNCSPDISDARIKFCEYATNEYEVNDPRASDRKNFKKRCSKEDKISSNLLLPGPTKILGHWLIAQGLYHIISNIENLDNYNEICLLRRIKFSISTTKRTISSFTKPIKIYVRIAELQWLEPISQNFEVFANHKFDIKLQIVDQNKKRIVSGLDSSLMVEITLRFQTKLFTRESLVEDFVYRSEVDLFGDEIITSYRNYDKVFHKRAKNGLVTFTNVCIRDVYQSGLVFLNATLTVPRTGERQPRDYKDMDQTCVKSHKMKIVFLSTKFCDYIIGHDCNLSHDSKTSQNQLYTFTEQCDARDKVKSVKYFSLKILEQTAYKLTVVDAFRFTKDLDDIPQSVFDTLDLSDKDSDIHVTSYFQIPGLWVLIVDEDNRRIYSGDDSELTINVETDPKDIQLSKNGTSFKTSRGLGSFLGAVQNVSVTVRFQFTAKGIKRGNLLRSNLSNTYVINAEIVLALYGRFNTAGARDDPDPVLASFAKLAIENLNNRIPELKDAFKTLFGLNFKFSIKIQDTEQSYVKAADVFMENRAKEEEGDRKKYLNGVIGFGDNEITHKMNALISSYKIPLVIYREDLKDFVRKDSYKTIASINWNSIDDTMYFGTVTQTMWKYVIMFEDVDSLITDDFRFGLKSTFKYTIAKYNANDVLFQILLRNQTNLTEEISAAKETGCRYVLTFVNAPKQYMLFREAIRNNFSPLHGYHWTSAIFYAKQFDFEDKHPYCALKPTCTEAFEGMTLFIATFNISGYSSDLWYRVNRNYYEMNFAEFYGLPTSRPEIIDGLIALGYDSVLSFAHAFEKQVANGYTITKGSTVLTYRGLEFEGLTGAVRFSGEGRARLGSIFAIVNVVSAKKPRNSYSHYFGHNCLQWQLMSDYYSQFAINHFSRKKRSSRYPTIFEKANLTKFRQIVEIPFQASEQDVQFYNMQYNPRLIPNERRLISRLYVSTLGFLSSNSKLLSFTKSGPLEEICLRTEIVLSPMYCSNGCGGGRLNSYSGLEYKHGTCVAADECRCRVLKEIYQNLSKTTEYKLAYSGKTCKNIICDKCYNGYCSSPYNCTCFTGWTGISCTNAECPSGCIHGKCVDPNYCKCNVGYYGSNCSVLIGVIAIFAIITTFICLILLGFLGNWLKKRSQMRNELENLDWLVNWKDVTERTGIVRSGITTPLTPASTILEGAMSDSFYSTSRKFIIKSSKDVTLSGSPVITRTGTGLTTPTFIENSVEWKDKICYAKKFQMGSLNVNNLSLRKEIMHLREIKHRNLVGFIGACLTSPNVALLVEVVPKGSLFDILQSDAYKLTWNFKFSMLRDIATGLDYLHYSKIRSHGRLKSTNILVDNRWSCKVSGFGVPSMRKVVYSIQHFDRVQRSMLWTAPELLRESLTLSDIGSGTKPGDVYSFGIVVTEMCTQDRPFYTELQILSVEELIRILKNLHDPANRGIKRLLEKYDYDTNKPIRPAINHTQMPVSYTERRGVYDLINMTTAEDPLLRLHFKEIIEKINSIHPLKGELIENLIYMLEKYTNHLEEMFIDKVKEVQIEKSKTEELISRLLPISIAEEMALHKEVPPKYYNNVTIFNSDIVGFSAIAQESKPMDVVDLLNDLYTCFDSIVENFNVYKLETAGDASCVVSGVPVPAPNHAQEIADMALNILMAVTDFPIRHMTEKKLQIRIGIHSGSCIAGVVGIKMPRFCIFGQDVTIAQYMESTGEPNSIQVSEDTARNLENIDSYYLTLRGVIEIKFIGTIKTFWLIGREGLIQQSILGFNTSSIERRRQETEKFLRRQSKMSVLINQREMTEDEDSDEDSDEDFEDNEYIDDKINAADSKAKSVASASERLLSDKEISESEENDNDSKIESEENEDDSKIESEENEDDSKIESEGNEDESRIESDENDDSKT